MSLTRGANAGQPPCFPRVSGDEPGTQKTDVEVALFSPRERG